MGGTFGEVQGAKLVGLLRAAAEGTPGAVLILFDTGGVRLQEANAGETAVAEIMAAICAARSAGVPVIGIVGGRAGTFGGGGLIAGTCSGLAVTEQGQIGVSEPEVIETNQGVEEFDSRDRALVWRITGGKHRALIGGADAFAEDTAEALREAAPALIDAAPAFDATTLRAEHERLAAWLERFGAAEDAPEIWRALRRGRISPRSTRRPSPRCWSGSGGGMAHGDILEQLFPDGHDVRVEEGILAGTAPLRGATATVIGVAEGTPPGVEGALRLAGAVLEAVERGDSAPIQVVIDSGSQRMRRRDELLGLNEYLAHLAKALRMAEARGHPTVGILHGHSAAGGVHRHGAGHANPRGRARRQSHGDGPALGRAGDDPAT